jgi:hypothetical protein
MFVKLPRRLIFFLCLLAVAIVFIAPPAMSDVTPKMSVDGKGQIITNSDNITSLTQLASAESEAEEPLSWWLIAIIVASGLLIVLVTWRLIRRSR